jgi:hypothetical protein
MKRRDLIRPLTAHGCEILREGGNHTVYVNRADNEHPLYHVIERSTNSWLERFAGTCWFPSLLRK